MNLAVAFSSFYGLQREGKIDLFSYLETRRYRYQLRSADIWNGLMLSTEDAYLLKVKDALEETEQADAD